MSRDCQNWNWKILDVSGKCRSTEHAKLAVLMDIRDELKSLNQHLRCHNFMEIPTILRGIRRKLPVAKKEKG